MSPVFWILLWIAGIALVAFFALREIRAKRRGPAEVDRTHHAAVRESTSRSQLSGPNGSAGTWLG